MITLDGSMGEGGGQILRSALALSLATDTPFTLENVRARRKSPGLLRQHLACVRAAVEISGASAVGAELGSKTLSFRPRPARAGAYRFAIGSAGSTTLVLQTVLVPLLLAQGSSSVRLEGGTHNPHAPPFDMLDRVFLATLRELGATVSARLERHGFYPAGGGAMVVEIEGGTRLRAFEAVHRGTPALTARVVFANLAGSIAAREAEVLAQRLGIARRDVAIERVGSAGPGNAVLVEAIAGDHREIVTSFGERSVSAEKVAADACTEMKEYLDAGAPIGRHFADQLLIPLALGGAGGSFRTLAASSHFETNARVIGSFLGELVKVEPEPAGTARVTVTASNRTTA